jgi:4-amino-4-deoxy-L-arabinose transferase-like glycosyltransferase
MRPKREYVGIAIIMASAVLTLVSLDHTPFWDDEADVAIVTRNLLKSGRLTGWDGRNLLAYHNGGLLDENLRPRDAPLHYFITAPAFALFGESTWSARFPFVLAGLLALGTLAVLVRRDFGTDSALWVYATAAMGLSLVFILNVRQCRYYSASLLCSLLAFLCYRRCLATRRAIDFIMIAVASVGMFYSNFLLCAVFLLSTAAVHLAFHGRAFERRDWAKIGLSVVIFLSATLPYALRYRIWVRPDMFYDTAQGVHRAALFWWNLQDLNEIALLPWAVVAGLVFVLLCRYRRTSHARVALEYGVLILSYTLFLAVFSPRPPISGMIHTVRYLIPILPFTAALVAVLAMFIHQRSRLMAPALLAIAVICNVFSITPWKREFRWLLPAYIHELAHPYPTCYSAVVEYLGDNAKQDETVFTWPTYTNYPIMFYLGDRLRFAGTLTRETHLPLDTLAALQAPLFIEEQYPTWFVAFGLTNSTMQVLRNLTRRHSTNGVRTQYQYTLLKTLDVYWFDTSRPELPMHSFGPKEDYDPRAEAVYVFRRGDAPSSARQPTGQ